MKRYFFLILWICFAYSVSAQKSIVVHSEGEVVHESAVTEIKSMVFSDNKSFIYFTDNEELSFPINAIDSITFHGESIEKLVSIRYNGETASVDNPYADSGIVVTVSGANVTVADNSGINNIHYYLSGSSDNGSFSLSNGSNCILSVDNLTLTSQNNPAININKEVNCSFWIVGECAIADASTNSKNNAIASKGSFFFDGKGTLSLAANKKNGISADKAITINDGTIHIASTVEDAKALKAEYDITINGGSLSIDVAGKQSKGISGKQSVLINSGNLAIKASGATAVESASTGTGYETSYCSAIKADSDIIINDGTINIELPSSNNGGKGLSADGDITIANGNITITTAGNGGTYTNSSGTTDSYTSSCIKSDGGISILGGTINCSSSGSGGKGISASGEIIIGTKDDDNESLILNVNTSGERFLVSSGSGGGPGGGGPGGGGPGGNNNSDYANPKAIKSEGNLTVNSGTINVRCTQQGEGGEGMESKATFTTNGGIIHIESYDDCINASSHIQINDGTIYCKASGNDGIDSNGTITIDGGFVISNGTRAPEEGFDCDNNRFSVNGGIIIGTGGATSNPTSAYCDQYVIKYSNATAGNAICITNAEGEIILLFQLPTYSSSGGGNSMVVLFSDPRLAAGSYKLQYGGTISGGTTVNGYNTGGTYSGGSSKSFTISSTKLVSI